MKRAGGKRFATETLKEYVPYYKILYSLFVGAAWLEVNLPKAPIYELWNDIDKGLMNYYEIIRDYPEEFESYKDGVHGIIYQKKYENYKRRLEIGEAAFNDKIEWAWAYFYVSKLSGLIGSSNIGKMKLNRPIKNQDGGLLTALNQRTIKRMQYVHILNEDFRGEKK